MIQNHDEDAKEYFVLKNKGLVYSCISRFSSSKTSKEDLFQIGCVGLMKALNHFDLKKEVQFSTYAIPIILGEIRRHFRDDSNIRIARSIKENYIKMQHIREKLVQQNHQEPAYEEIAMEGSFTIEEVYIAFDAHQQLASMDEEIAENDGKSITLNDQLSKISKDELLSITLKKEINTLTNKEKLILYFRYTLGYKQQEIAKRLNCTQVQVSRMEKAILMKLKDRMI